MAGEEILQREDRRGKAEAMTWVGFLELAARPDLPEKLGPTRAGTVDHLRLTKHPHSRGFGRSFVQMVLRVVRDITFSRLTGIVTD